MKPAVLIVTHPSGHQPPFYQDDFQSCREEDGTIIQALAMPFQNGFHPVDFMTVYLSQDNRAAVARFTVSGF